MQFQESNKGDGEGVASEAEGKPGALEKEGEGLKAKWKSIWKHHQLC